MQWLVVSTLCQETKIHLNRKVGSWRTPKIGPVLEVTTSYVQGKHGVEIRIMSMNKDNSHSWIRISHGLNKLVTNLKNNEQETSEMQFEECALRLMRVILQAVQKPKQNHKEENLPTHPQRLFLLGKEFGPMLNQENIQFLIMKCQRNWFVCFVMEVYLEKTMKRLNS